MTYFRRPIVLLATIVLILAACGGGGGATAAPDGGVVASGPTDAAATAAPTPEAPAGATPTASEPSSDGSGGGVCDLVTVAELEEVFGVSSIATEVFAGPPDTCDIQSDGAPIAAFVFTPTGGGMIFDLLAAGADAQDVGGIGDGAFWSDETRLLVVKKGDSMLSVAAYDVNRTEEENKGLVVEMAKIAAGRM